MSNIINTVDQDIAYDLEVSGIRHQIKEINETANMVKQSEIADDYECRPQSSEEAVEKTGASIPTKGFKSKSDAIRQLNAQGWSRSAIAVHLGIKYQFVRNVLVNQVPKRS